MFENYSFLKNQQLHELLDSYHNLYKLFHSNQRNEHFQILNYNADFIIFSKSFLTIAPYFRYILKNKKIIIIYNFRMKKYIRTDI